MVFIMTTIYFDQFDSQVGVIGVLAGPVGVREVGWRLDPRGASTEPDEMVQRALGQLREYFAGQRREFALPLDLPPMEPVDRGGAARAQHRRLWENDHLRRTGRAERHGSTGPGHRRDHGGQPVPIIIPCHRVVASDGLGGYSGGEPGRQLETKRWLLENEGALPPALV
jgi:methylated-DNA-[protein]-cysteine S-methyltransferase